MPNANVFTNIRKHFAFVPMSSRPHGLNHDNSMGNGTGFNMGKGGMPAGSSCVGAHGYMGRGMGGGGVSMSMGMGNMGGEMAGLDGMGNMGGGMDNVGRGMGNMGRGMANMGRGMANMDGGMGKMNGGMATWMEAWVIWAEVGDGMDGLILGKVASEVDEVSDGEEERCAHMALHAIDVVRGTSPTEINFLELPDPKVLACHAQQQGFEGLD
ncbi:hypothetical protein BT96DRAFT_1006840 [Gymnopus androsaceus JB14]|uniref:Uncharacterized protein n=1 Tax=Gymnopus androsaceus JB14 TaxID=1447944 RepID=A0A6A4GJY1_9AGAR|nr:hypothetical protein BT96DRAFT_1006840 [Gymnopus androsaceus JB14]